MPVKEARQKLADPAALLQRSQAGVLHHLVKSSETSIAACQSLIEAFKQLPDPRAQRLGSLRQLSLFMNRKLQQTQREHTPKKQATSQQVQSTQRNPNSAIELVVKPWRE